MRMSEKQPFIVAALAPVSMRYSANTINPSVLLSCALSFESETTIGPILPKSRL